MCLTLLSSCAPQQHFTWITRVGSRSWHRNFEQHSLLVIHTIFDFCPCAPDGDKVLSRERVREKHLKRRRKDKLREEPGAGVTATLGSAYSDESDSDGEDGSDGSGDFGGKSDSGSESDGSDHSSGSDVDGGNKRRRPEGVARSSGATSIKDQEYAVLQMLAARSGAV